MTKIYLRLCLLSIICFNSLLADENLKKIVKCYIPITKTYVKMELNYLANIEPKRRGLMFVKSIKKGEGLLIKVDENQIGRTWMKNMLTPIDIIFLDPTGFILATIENAQPCSKEIKCTITSVKNTQYIIETSPGFILNNHLYYSDKCLISDEKK